MIEMIKEYIQSCISDIRTKTAKMTKGEAFAYVMTYYWYHILGIVAVIGLVIFLPVHFIFGNKKPVFTCVMVNQEISFTRDASLQKLLPILQEHSLTGSISILILICLMEM